MKKLRVLLLALILIPSIMLFSACGSAGQPGDKGDKGNQGEQGIPGETGIKGDSYVVIGDTIIVIYQDENGNTTTKTIQMQSLTDWTSLYTFDLFGITYAYNGESVEEFTLLPIRIGDIDYQYLVVGSCLYFFDSDNNFNDYTWLDRYYTNNTLCFQDFTWQTDTQYVCIVKNRIVTDIFDISDATVINQDAAYILYDNTYLMFGYDYWNEVYNFDGVSTLCQLDGISYIDYNWAIVVEPDDYIFCDWNNTQFDEPNVNIRYFVYDGKAYIYDYNLNEYLKNPIELTSYQDSGDTYQCFMYNGAVIIYQGSSRITDDRIVQIEDITFFWNCTGNAIVVDGNNFVETSNFDFWYDIKGFVYDGYAYVWNDDSWWYDDMQAKCEVTNNGGFDEFIYNGNTYQFDGSNWNQI